MNESALNVPLLSCDCPDNEENSGRKSHHEEKTIRELVVRMNRIEGQVRGIRGMIERQVYCDDILNQISSARSALDGVSKLLLEKHMKSCVKERLENGDTQVVDEVLNTVASDGHGWPSVAVAMDGEKRPHAP
ncbi:metal-sensitive transcriptional regulator [Paradesulfitobacterium ferrireducens]|uniref:metal-sensitive transcriptional regulator n=1 Tax=Paradesulfitobacterium ferrireducens TaxID=2816476 RepID=UPI001A9019CB|nr:metal-sensitive transcriptional regulator [Paradesulfitobacterium ferrireducens]